MPARRSNRHTIRLRAFLIFRLLALASSVAFAYGNLDKGGDCDEYNAPALGMESGAIADSQLYASSSFDVQSVGQQNARIRTEKASGAWCPKQQIRDDSAEYLQVDLLQPYVIHTIETQGRYGNGTGREFTEFYFIDYSTGNDGANLTWARYRARNGDSLINGNTDTVTAVKRRLDPPITARLIRVVPYSQQTRTACLRVEFYGCKNIEIQRPPPANSSRHAKQSNIVTASDVHIVPFPSQQHFVIAVVSLVGLCTLVCLTAVVVRMGRSRAAQCPLKSKSAAGEFTLRADGTKCAQNCFYSSAMRAEPAMPQSPPPSTIFGAANCADPAPRANLVTTLGAKGLPTHLLQRLQTFAGADGNPPSECYATVLPHQSPKAKNGIIQPSMTMPTSGTLSSCCSASITGGSTTSAASTCPKGSRVQAPPSLRDFNFPPPPPPATRRNSPKKAAGYRVYSGRQTYSDEDNIYAEPTGLESARLLDEPSGRRLPPTQQSPLPPMRTSASTFAACRQCDQPVAQLAQKSHSARSHRRPLPKPRTSATLDQIRGLDHDANHSLPKRLVKTNSPESGIGCDSRNCVSQCSNHSCDIGETIATDPVISSGPILISSLSIEDRIGGGKFTSLYLASCKAFPGRALALKALKADASSASAARQALRAEAQILSSLEHPNIVKYIGECDDGSILTEYVESGDLRNALSQGRLKISESLFVNLCGQITSALAHLEARQIVHGHFSTRSCLLVLNTSHSECPSPSPSSSRDSLAAWPRLRVASPRGPNLHAQLRFSAPEAIILNEWSNKTDVWSYGASAWEILHNAQVLPLSPLSNAQLLANARRILDGTADAIVPDAESLSTVISGWQNGTSIGSMLAKCWSAKPSERPDFRHLHAFFEQLNVELRSTSS